MWIIPKSLASAYAADMKGLASGSKELSQICESSFTLRSNFTSAKYWSILWRRDKSTPLRYGLILKPCKERTFMERWTSSLPDIPVSRSVKSGNEKERRMNGIYGRISSESSRKSNQKGYFSRMWRDMSASAHPKSSMIWRQWVSGLRLDYSRRLRSALLIRESGCSYLAWPTPKAQNCNGPGMHGKGGMDLQTTVGRQDRAKSNSSGKSRELSNWPSPRASDDKNPNCVVSSSRIKRPDIMNLPEKVGSKNWPTPRGQKISSPDTCGKVPDELKGKRLNPDWVEQLMGLPVGWTQLSGAKPGENRIDRLRLLGNGVVPQTAEKAFRVLLKKIKKPQYIQQSLEDYL